MPKETTRYRVKRSFTGKDGRVYEMGREYESTDHNETQRLLREGSLEESPGGEAGQE